MREVVFLRNNEKKWRIIETKISNSYDFSNDELSFYFTDLSSDLAYAQSNYPSSKTTIYLNELCASLYLGLRKKERNWFRKLIHFFSFEIPMEVYRSKNAMFLSLFVFGLSIIFGAISTFIDPDFPKLILGEEYVLTTLEFIDHNEPMAIYGLTEEALMFFQITINNIRVAMLTFISGVFFGIGSYIQLFRNGIMLGSFQYFFQNQEVLYTSLLTIWIHGTIEISSIVIAGGAGITLGHGLLFPQNLPRKKSLLLSAKRGTTIILGLIPMFIIAGFLESFATRHVEWPAWVKIMIILLSALLILGYFVYLPWKLNREKQNA